MDELDLKHIEINIDLKVDNKVPKGLANELESTVLKLKDLCDDLQDYYDLLKEKSKVVVVKDVREYVGEVVDAEDSIEFVTQSDNTHTTLKEQVDELIKYAQENEITTDETTIKEDVKIIELEDRNIDDVVEKPVQSRVDKFQYTGYLNKTVEPTWSSLVVSFAEPIANDEALMANLPKLKNLLDTRLEEYNKSNEFNVELSADEYKTLVDDVMLYLYRKAGK